MEKKISKPDLDYYFGVIKACELSGKHYIKKSHYKAILDMAKKDGKLKTEKKNNQKKSSFSSFDTDDFFNAALRRGFRETGVTE